MNRTYVLVLALIVAGIAPGEAADRRVRQERSIIQSVLSPRSAPRANPDTVALVTVDAGDPFGIRLNGIHVQSAVTLSRSRRDTRSC